ncbi:MAG: GNAT family N-acetyltransferase [Planctomycetota bacterium]
MNQSAPPTPRPLTPDDVTLYAALRREMLLDAPWAFCSGPDDPGAGGADEALILQRLAQPETTTFVIEDGPRLVASATVIRLDRRKLRHRAEIVAVYVTPSHRNRGLGRAVLTAAIQQAKAWQGVESIALSASSNSPAAIALYESLGFVVWGREPGAMRVGDHTYDEVHLQLALTASP